MEDLEREEKKRAQIITLKENFAETDSNLELFFECLGDESWRVRKEAVELATKYPADAIIKLLILGLSSEENAGLRNASQEALSLIGIPAIPYLKKHFSAADEDVRKFILDIMGDIRCKDVCDFLTDALNDTSENVVIAACENIGKIGCENAVTSLMNLLNPEKQWLSFVIIEALAQIGVPFDAEKIIPLFDVSQLRKPILDLLPLIKPPHNIELLKKSFSENSNYLKINAARKLYELFEQNREQLSELKKSVKDYITYNEIYEKLLEPSANESKVFALLAFITEDEKFFKSLIEKADDEALELFGSFSSYAPFSNISLIVSSLDEYHDKKQAYLAYLCGVFGASNAKQKLIELCQAQFGHTRQAIAFSLGRLGGETAVNCLFKLMNDPYPDVREQAVNSLALLINKDNFPYHIADEIFLHGEKDKLLSLLELLHKTDAINKNYLNKALKSPFSDVREKAVQIIGERKVHDLTNELLFYLTDENENVQLRVIEALGNIGNKDCVETLVNFLASDDLQIKKAAIESIYKLAPEILAKHQEKIFEDVTPFSFFGLLTLLEKGLPLSSELFIKKAFEFDDKDIFIELTNFFRTAGMEDVSLKLTSLIEKEKGKDYLPVHISQESISTGD